MNFEFTLTTGRALRHSENAHESAVQAYVNSLHKKKKIPNTFWKRIDHLVNLIEERINSKYHVMPIENAIDEFIRLVLVARSPVFKSMKDVALFLAQYERVKADIRDELYEIEDLYKSDDGIMDLSDMLPLAGAKVYDMLMAQVKQDQALKIIKNESDLEKHVKASVTNEKLVKKIMDGEYYVTMKLMDKLCDSLSYLAVQMDSDF